MLSVHSAAVGKIVGWRKFSSLTSLVVGMSGVILSGIKATICKTLPHRLKALVLRG